MAAETVHIIGGGLAGSEAAWQLAQQGVPVVIHEMRSPARRTEAHQTDTLAELVCSNSFRSDDDERNAVGLLHYELRQCASLILACADRHRVPAGSALAVDREGFAAAVQAELLAHPLINLERSEITTLDHPDWACTVVATGPLTSSPLAEVIQDLTQTESLAFFDAIAPIVFKDSIDFSKAWYQSRYDKGDGQDYINCPMTQAQYEAFIQALRQGEKTEFKDWEKDTPYFEGCLPIEVMADRGVDTLRFGPMKPVGLTNPHCDDRPYAVVQLRQDNALGTLYNMCGFQTKLRYGAQKEIFRTIPGLEQAEFARLGGIHRNTFINSPKLLDRVLRLKARPDLRFAGQITGVEGYLESAAIGLLVGRFIAAEQQGQPVLLPPATTALGALLRHITEYANAETFQPMNVNFGLFPPLTERTKKVDRKQKYTQRAKQDLAAWLVNCQQAAA